VTDLTIFFMGILVSLVVAGAVGLLLWGAANEPRGTLLPRSWSSDDPAPDLGNDLGNDPGASRDPGSDRKANADEGKPLQRVG